MKDNVIVVTGATSGIGQVTAFELARHGATVVGVGRNPEKCARVSQYIRKETGNPAVEYLLADLSVMAQVRRLAEEFRSKYDRLDVLVNNAGGFFTRRLLTTEGIEMTWALNHLAYFLLTNLLLDMMKACAPARIINVSSDAHGMGNINFDDLEYQRFFLGWKAYGRSKLANVLFTYELARRLDGTGVTANAMHPGFVASNFGLQGATYISVVYKLSKPFARTPVKGAETAVYLATSPEVEGVTGKYFFDCHPIRSSNRSNDRAMAERLWEVSERYVNPSPPAVTGRT